MDLQYALRTNGTVRSFKDEPVGLDTVAAILDDARFAPSGGNGQPWRVAVVEDRPLRRGLADLMQPVWDEYLEIRMAGGQPYTVVGYETPDEITPGKPNELLDNIDSVPVVLAVAADLDSVADRRLVFAETIVIAGDGAGTDVGFGADCSIANIGQMIRLGAASES